jgi:hypothetical protein
VLQKNGAMGGRPKHGGDSSTRLTVHFVKSLDCIRTLHCYFEKSICFSEKIPLIIDDRTSRLLACIRCIEACVVLHNMLLEMKNNDADVWLPSLDPVTAPGALPNNGTTITVSVNEEQAETVDDSEPEEETTSNNNKQMYLYRRFLAIMDMEEDTAQI